MNETVTYIEGSIEIPNKFIDPVCNFIIENISNGLVLEEEEDSPTTLIRFYLSPDDNHNFENILNDYMQSVYDLESEENDIPQINKRSVKNVEWEESYRRSVPVVRIADDVIIRPPWAERTADSKFDIMIEPKMAFGTGTHETTQGCLEVIRKHFKPGMRFLDIGCGSGILAILASQMGAEYIKAVDYDIIAVENCRENFILNEVETKNDILHGSIEKCENDSTYEFVCANIIKETILTMLTELKELTVSGGTLVLSGLLDKDSSEIEEALNNIGLTKYEILRINEWRTFTIHRD